MKRKSDMVREINTLKADNAKLTTANYVLEAKVRDSDYQRRDAEENADLARKLMLSAAKGFGLTGYFGQATFDSEPYEGNTLRITLVNVRGDYSVGVKPGDRIGLFLVDEKL